MKVNVISDFSLDIYLKKELVEKVNFTSKESLEEYLKKLFKKLNNTHNIKIEGYYEICIYIDKFYGVILHLEKENLEYYDYFKNQVDMKINTIHTEFSYLIDDIPKNLINKVKIFSKNNNLYLKLSSKLSKLEMMQLIENSEIKYDSLDIN